MNDINSQSPTTCIPENLNVLLGHDWLVGMRGGERVLEILCELFPSAPVYTLIHKKSLRSDIINKHPIHSSWMQNIPGIFSNYRYFLPFIPSAFESFNTPEADLMITSSHCAAKGLIPQQGTKHLCYCFTPMRYAWLFYNEYFGKNPIKAALAKPVLSRLRAWDKKSADRVDKFVAISHHVQKRIKDFYGRESDVVYPPVDTKRCTPSNKEHDNFDLVVSALVPYKRIDLAVSAYSISGKPLKVVGIGGEYKKLKSMAGPNIEFLGWQSDESILKLYQSCRMLIFPGEEDFGIVPIEAQACGRPVVAFGRGGLLETVDNGTSGVFFKEQTSQSLINAVDECAAIDWNQDAIRQNAEKFSTDNFIKGISNSIQNLLKEKSTKH